MTLLRNHPRNHLPVGIRILSALDRLSDVVEDVEVQHLLLMLLLSRDIVIALAAGKVVESRLAPALGKERFKHRSVDTHFGCSSPNGQHMYALR